jgi:hypothetical protein
MVAATAKAESEALEKECEAWRESFLLKHTRWLVLYTPFFDKDYTARLVPTPT